MRPVEIRHALPGDIRQPAWKPLARRPRHELRQSGQHGKAHRKHRRETQTGPQAPGLPDREAGHGHADEDADRDPPRVGRRARVFDERRPQRDQRRHPAHRQQRQHGEEHANHQPGERAPAHRGPRDEKIHLKRQHARQQSGQGHLHHEAQRRSRQGPEDAQRQALHQVDGKALPGARPEAAEYRHRGDLLPHINVNRTRDPDRAEKQRHKTHQAEKALDVFQRPPEIAFSFRHGVEGQLLRPKPPPHVLRDHLHRGGRRQLQQRPVPDQHRLGREARRLERAHRNQRPRRDRGGDRRGFTRQFLQRARHRERRLPEFHLVARLDVELPHQCFLENRHIATLPESRDRIDGVGQKLAVKRKVALQRAHIHQPRQVLRGRKHHHRRKTDFPGHLRPNPGQIGAPFRAEGRTAGDDQIRAEQSFRLVVDRPLQIGAERPDRHERGDAEYNRKRKQHEPPARRPRIPPGHFKNESHESLPTEHTEYTEYTEESEDKPLVLDFRKMPEIHQQSHFQPCRVKIILNLRAVLVRQL